MIRPYYLRPDGQVGHDAFAVIQETIREMNKVAIGRLVLTSREHIIALEPLDKGLMGTLLRYPYEVRDPKEYFDEIDEFKVTKDMLDLARHIVDQKSGFFEPDKFEDQYETALVDVSLSAGLLERHDSVHAPHSRHSSPIATPLHPLNSPAVSSLEG